MGSITKYASQSYASTIKSCHRPGVALELGLPFNMFTIRNGPILITQFYGLVTQLIAGAATPVLNHNPVGAAPNAAIATVAVDIDTDAVGTIYTWTGAVGGVLGPVAQLGVCSPGETLFAGNMLLLTPGVINITDATAIAVTGGLIDWYVTYLPCSDEAYMTSLP